MSYRQDATDHQRCDTTDPFGSERHYPPDLGLEPLHLEIDLAFDLQTRSARGRVTTTVEARRDGPNCLALDAVDFQELDVADADGHAIDWHYDGQQIHVRWRAPLVRAEQRPHRRGGDDDGRARGVRRPVERQGSGADRLLAVQDHALAGRLLQPQQVAKQACAHRWKRKYALLS